MIQVETRCLLHMAEAVAAEVFAAVPAGHDDQLTRFARPAPTCAE